MQDGHRKNLGIDIGGTKVSIGVVNEQGIILDKMRIPSDSCIAPFDFVVAIVKAINALLVSSDLGLDDIDFVGVGVPGTADSMTGFVSYCPNLQWFDVPLGEYFRKCLKGKTVTVAQDSRNGALAEFLFGAGRGFSDVMCISIGTGVGCGIILDGKIFNGSMNTAGELGHSPIVRGGRPCTCGNKGCLERYVSGSGIAIGAHERFPDKFQGRQITSEAVFELANSGDADVLDYIMEVVDYLALGIANAVSLLSPQAVIISGGLCENEELFIKPLQKKVNDNGYFSWVRQRKFKVMKAELGADAPLIGASILYKGL